jgi:hypothetical protein
MIAELVCQNSSEGDDSARVFVGALLAGVAGNVLVQTVEVVFGERCEDDLHKTSVRLARHTAGLDTWEHRVRRHAFGWVGQVFAVAWQDFLAEPALYGGIALEQRAYAVAHDFADGGIGTRLDLALDGFGHVERQGDAELLGGSHKLRG